MYTCFHDSDAHELPGGYSGRSLHARRCDWDIFCDFGHEAATKNARLLCEPGVALFPMLEVPTGEATQLLHEGVVTFNVWAQMRKLFFELLQQCKFPNALESTVLDPCRATQNALLV